MAAIHLLSSTKHSFETCLDYVLSVTLYSGLAISGMQMCYMTSVRVLVYVISMM